MYRKPTPSILGFNMPGLNTVIAKVEDEMSKIRSNMLHVLPNMLMTIPYTNKNLTFIDGLTMINLKSRFIIKIEKKNNVEIKIGIMV